MHNNNNKIMNRIKKFLKSDDKNTTLSDSILIIKNTNFFNLKYYCSQCQIDFDSSDKAIKHYLTIGYKKGYNPSSKFNGNTYLKKYPDVKDANMNPLVHYIKHGRKEGKSDKCDKNTREYKLVKQSNLFDYHYYEQEYNYKFKSYHQALINYLEIGYKKGYNPSSKFNGNTYLKKYPDVKKSGYNPLVHYLKHGRKEGRSDIDNINTRSFKLVKNSGLFDYKYYEKQTGKQFKNENKALHHYLEQGYKNNYKPHPNFNAPNYIKKYPAVKEHNINPLVHYLRYGRKEGKTDKCDKNTREYKLVKQSNLFDYHYYEEECGMQFETYHQALMNYLEIGYKRGYNPNPEFNGNDYFRRYPQVKRAKYNPLVHYIKYGIKEKRFLVKKSSFRNFNQLTDVNNILNNLFNKTLIIIEMKDLYNTQHCIENLINTSSNFRVVILNINYSLRLYDTLNQYYIIESIYDVDIENIYTIIEKITKTYDEVFIFIKDNILPFNNWIKKLVIAAYSNNRIGMVSPISNYSPISIIDYPNNEKSAEITNNISNKDYIETYIPNDSCIYIKNEVFDELNINTDININNYLYKIYEKASQKGWKLVFDDSTYVYYENDKQSNKQKDLYNIDKYNTQNQVNLNFANSEAFKTSIDLFDNENNEYENNSFNKKNILIAMHYGGGVEFTVRDIANSLKDYYNFYMIKAYENKLELYELKNNNLILKEIFNKRYSWNSQMIFNEEYKQIYTYILLNYNINLVEIDHSIFNTFDLAYISKKLDIPVIVAIHDFYYICPTYFLLNEKYEYCGGYCDNVNNNCSVRVEWFDLPANIVKWKNQWQNHVQQLFDVSDMIITSTNFTKNMFLEHYPMLKSNDIKIIEHGRDLVKFNNIYSMPNKYQPIKILIPGTISIHKGSEFIKKLKQFDVNNRLEFHYIGQVDKELEEIGINHGIYLRDQFAKHVYKIKPSFIGIFSICAETYSYTLTEAFSCGVPVLASNLGALKTRIEKNGGGWLIDVTKPEEAYQKILDIVDNKEEYKHVQEEMANIKIVSTKEMGENYLKLYESLINNKNNYN